jgi:hypothetical protein
MELGASALSRMVRSMYCRTIYTSSSWYSETLHQRSEHPPPPVWTLGWQDFRVDPSWDCSSQNKPAYRERERGRQTWRKMRYIHPLGDDLWRQRWGGLCNSGIKRNDLLIAKSIVRDYSSQILNPRWPKRRLNILESILGKKKKRVGMCRIDASGSGWGPRAGCCEHGNEPSGSIKWEEIQRLERAQGQDGRSNRLPDWQLEVTLTQTRRLQRVKWWLK